MQINIQSLYHVTFSTFNQEETIKTNGQKVLFKYIWELLKNKNCELYRINGTANHLHLAMSLQPLIALDSIVKDIQHSTTEFIEESRLFPDFTGWQDGYVAFTHSFKEKSILTGYIKDQEKFHEKNTFDQELAALLRAHGIEEKS